MHRLMDVVAVESLGRDGKQLTLFKAAPHRFDPTTLPARKPARGKPREPATDVVFRKATADDAIEIMRLFYDCYRYSYFNEQVYSPRALGRMIANGDIASFVAALPSGRLVAHLALLHDPSRPDAIECGMAAADPAYRGRHLFNGTVMLATEEILRSRKRVLFAGCVTAHVASQKFLLHDGINECGLMLGAVPAEEFTGGRSGAAARSCSWPVSSPTAPRPSSCSLPPMRRSSPASMRDVGFLLPAAAPELSGRATPTSPSPFARKLERSGRPYSGSEAI
jgi:hypothetical protein